MSSTGAGVRRLVSVDELRRAWRAIDAGQFRVVSSPSPGAWPEAPVLAGRWVPAAGERVVAVVGCAGSVGASSVALAIGSVWAGSARVVECCPAAASGLAAATTAELGRHRSGWLVGRRAGLVIDRAADRGGALDGLVPRDDAAADLSVLDAGGGVEGLLAGDGWLPAAVLAADAVVVVAAATVPGMRRLAAAVEVLAPLVPAGRLVATSRGARRSTRPRRVAGGVARAGGPVVAQLRATGRLIDIPHDSVLAVTGCDSRPLPAALLAAAARVVEVAGLRPVTATA